MPFGGLLTAGIGGLASILGGVVANASTADQRAAAQQASQQALQQIQAVGAGPDLAKQIILDQYKQAGIYTPQLEQTITQGISKAANLQERDPATRNAQMDALSQFQQLGQTGLTQTDRAALNQARQSVDTDTNGRLQSILQGMAQRGMANSGSSLASQLQQSQGGTNQLSASADRIAQQAQQARIAALQQAAQIGSSVRGQDYSVDLGKAQAADELSRFNTQQATNAQQYNVGAQNQAQQYNLTNAQNISNANTSNANQELLRQKQAEQQQYENQLNNAKLQSGALSNYGNQQSQNAQNSAQNINSIFGGIGKAVSGIGSTLGTTAPKYDSKTGKALYDPVTGLPLSGPSSPTPSGG